MGNVYTNSLAEVTPSYPGAVFSPREVRDKASEYAITGETFTAPALVSGRSLYQLQMVPRQSTITVTLSSVAQTLVPFGTTPAAGEVAVSYATGVIELPAAQAEVGSYSASYTGLGTPITSDLMNRIQKELAAAQQQIDDAVGFALPVGGVDGDILTSDGAGSADWTTTLPVANGGTGATVAATALSNLGGAPLSTTIVEKTAAHTLEASDNGKILIFSGLSAGVNLTIPAGLTTFVSCIVINADPTYDVTIVDSAITLVKLDGLIIELGGAGVSIIHRGSDSYVAVGRLAAT